MTNSDVDDPCPKPSIHERAVVASPSIAVDQQVSAAVGPNVPSKVTGANVSLLRVTACPVLEFIAGGAHIVSLNEGATHASNRTTPRRSYLLLSPLRGTLLRDAFAAFQE
jgi:hypothetical protein